MDKKKVTFTSEEAKKRKDSFIKKLNSEMIYHSDLTSDFMDFEWLSEIEYACPFIDLIVRNPKLALVKEEIVVPTEKSKIVTPESVKDLMKHPTYINKIDEETGEPEIKKILNVINEETYNIYENRFLYTLINNLDKFVYEREQELKNFEFQENKSLEYSADTFTTSEKVNIIFRITSESFPNDKPDKKLMDSIRIAKTKIKRVKDFIQSWLRSPMYKEIDNAHINPVKVPIKKTNILLKNPNFQVALKLFEYLNKFDNTEENNAKDNLNKDYDPLQGFLDHSFLIDYFVLDSISRTRFERKEKMGEYAILMLKEEIHRTVRLLLDLGIEITSEELIKMIAEELSVDKEKPNYKVSSDDVKKKFKNAMDEYLERIQGNL